jgi:acetyl esterase
MKMHAFPTTKKLIRSTTNLITVCGVLAFALIPNAHVSSGAEGQPTQQKAGSNLTQERRVYKTVGTRELCIDFTFPANWKQTDMRPVIVFFFGGGWNGGSVEQFAYQAEYFASRGMVAARADYRVKSRDDVTPDQCVTDARSAARWIRKHATQLGVNPNQFIASGGSAGGHLAACLFVRDSVEDKQDDLSISTMPQAMVLYNPALDFTQPNLLKRVNGDKALAEQISPTLHLDRTTPPSILFCGTEDALALPENIAYSEKARETGIRADMVLAEGQKHGFFNRPPWLQRTTIAADKFLASLGILEGAPTLQEPSPDPVKTAETTPR